MTLFCLPRREIPQFDIATPACCMSKFVIGHSSGEFIVCRVYPPLRKNDTRWFDTFSQIYSKYIVMEAHFYVGNNDRYDFAKFVQSFTNHFSTVHSWREGGPVVCVMGFKSAEDILWFTLQCPIKIMTSEIPS